MRSGRAGQVCAEARVVQQRSSVPMSSRADKYPVNRAALNDDGRPTVPAGR
jgi:hypothetical protein